MEATENYYLPVVFGIIGRHNKTDNEKVIKYAKTTWRLFGRGCLGFKTDIVKKKEDNFDYFCLIPEKDENELYSFTHPIGIGASKIRMRLEYNKKTLDEFEVLSMLGVGSFGKVQLVQDKQVPERVFALKALAKSDVVNRSQQEHVLNEKRILIGINSPFIVQLYKTFKDDRFVYFLMEVCLGGELWTILRDSGPFDESMTRFYSACVVEALDHLHQRRIAYRDLKPENLLMDSRGYVKLIDFGFAKNVGVSGKTKTICGTPEYVAPEVILDEGHDCAVDYWSLGILIYELMTGNPPFPNDTMLVLYQAILSGFTDYEFSEQIPKRAKNLIMNLCKENPKERLGCRINGVQDIRKHKWYKDFKWQLLQNRVMQSPVRPKIDDKMDTSNFDQCGNCEAQEEITNGEFSGWDEYF